MRDILFGVLLGLILGYGMGFGVVGITSPAVGGAALTEKVPLAQDVLLERKEAWQYGREAGVR